MIEAVAVASSTVKCAKCGAALGPTGTFTIIGADWFHSCGLLAQTPQSAIIPHSWCAPMPATNARSLDEALAKLNRDLPGWWWTVGDCSISSDASMGPDRNGPDAHLLTQKIFDEGFHAELAQPATPAEALLFVLEIAKSARNAARLG